jgi:hypothetical protein
MQGEAVRRNWRRRRMRMRRRRGQNEKCHVQTCSVKDIDVGRPWSVQTAFGISTKKEAVLPCEEHLASTYLAGAVRRSLLSTSFACLLWEIPSFIADVLVDVNVTICAHLSARMPAHTFVAGFVPANVSTEIKVSMGASASPSGRSLPVRLSLSGSEAGRRFE